MDGTNHFAGTRRRAALVIGGTALALAAVVVAQRDDDSSATAGAAAPASTPAPVTEPSTPPDPPRSRGAERPRPEPPRTEPPPPARVRIPESASGRFAVAPDRSRQVGRGPLLRYTVSVERGLPYAIADVAPIVDATLADPRGWTKGGRHAFQRVPRRPDFRVLLSSPDTTDELCAPLLTRGQVSCRNGALVVLNARRWAYGIPDYDGDLRRYRQYVVNHEVGHVLGADHVPCPGRGRPAPLMQQQSYGLDGCRPNAWPR